MSKPKTMIKQSKKKRKEQVLEEADDYLADTAAGVEHEESAGKWRAGDAVKSLRFFNRAIEIYDQGLTKYPRNLDLAYNKARVELEVATHPLLVRHLDTPLIAVLDAALTSHRYALDLDPNNADTLFNVAQVLVSIAEELAKDDSRTSEALQFLEEALEMQNRCLSVQELKYEESEQQRRSMLEAQAGEPTEQPATAVAPSSQPSTPSSTTAAAEDQWFSILEPITPDTLIDTILAQISTLTTLCSIIATTFPPPTSPTLSWIGSYPSPFINDKLPLLATNASPDRLAEIALTKAHFLSRLLEAGFRHLDIDAATYARERDAAFAVPELQLSRSGAAQLAKAESQLTYAAALTETEAAAGHPFAAQRWAALSAAITSLGAASKLDNLAGGDVARTHFLRGDASLLLFMLGRPPVGYQQAVSNAGQLLKNAEVFYRNASRLESEDEEGKAVAGLRSTVAQVLQGKTPEAPLGSDTGREEAWVRAQIGEMIEDELVPEGFMGFGS